MSFLDHDDKTEFAMHYGTAKQHHAILDAGPSFNTMKTMVTTNVHKEIVDRLVGRGTTEENHTIGSASIHGVIAQTTKHTDHLDKLMDHADPNVRKEVAANEHIQSHHIDRLMHDTDDAVVHRLSRQGGKMQPYQREHMAKHPDELIVGEIAKHPSMHDKLISHPDEHVRHRVAQYAVKKEHLDTLATDPSAHVRASAAANRHAGHLHSILMHDPDEKVRRSVAMTTQNKEVAQHLSKDSSGHVADMAEQRVKHLNSTEHSARTAGLRKVNGISESSTLLNSFKQFISTEEQ